MEVVEVDSDGGDLGRCDPRKRPLALQDGTKKETIAASSSSLLASFSHLLSSVARSVEQTDAKLCLLELKNKKEINQKTNNYVQEYNQNRNCEGQHLLDVVTACR